jgi:drug/metabolite transporter (DMT)-like permease
VHVSRGSAGLNRTLSDRSPSVLAPSVIAVAAPVVLTDTASDTLRGIGYVVLAYFMLTVGDVVTKLVLPEAGVSGAMIGRGVFGALGIAGLALAQPVPQPWRMLVPKRWGMVLARALLSSFVSIAWYIAWRTMSLADTYAIGFTTPLLMTLMAVPMLGERIRWRRLMSTLVGFGGVLIMLRPEGEMWKPVVPLLLISIVVMALTRIMTRALATTESPQCLAVWLLISHTLAGCVMLPFYPPAGVPSLLTCSALVLVGLANGLGHWVFARGYALAPVSALAPYEYTMLPFGGLFGLLVFAEIPSWSTLAGAAVLIGAGLYNWHRERVPRVAELAGG